MKYWAARLVHIKYELIMLAIMLSALAFSMPGPESMDEWCTTPYALTYQFGFSSRMLIGSIIYLFTPYLSTILLWRFILIMIILLCLLIAIALGEILRNADKSYKSSVIVLILLWFLGPASVVFLFAPVNFGRFDTCLLIFTLIAIFIANMPRLRFLIPVICFMGMATNQVFAFTYWIIILGVLLFNMFEEGYNKAYTGVTIISIAVASMSFIYFQFLTPALNASNVNDVVAILQQRTNIPVSQRMINMEYFASIRDHINILVVPTSRFNGLNWKSRLLTGLIVIVLMLPQIILLINIWRNAIINAEERLKHILFFMVMSPLASIPAFILTIDWGRWFAAVFIAQHTFILYLVYKKCPPILSSMQTMQTYYLSHLRGLGLLVLTAIYMAMLGKFQASYILLIARWIALNMVK